MKPKRLIFGAGRLAQQLIHPVAIGTGSGRGNTPTRPSPVHGLRVNPRGRRAAVAVRLRKTSVRTRLGATSRVLHDSTAKYFPGGSGFAALAGGLTTLIALVVYSLLFRYRQGETAAVRPHHRH